MSLPAWIVRNLTYPWHEWLRGRPTLCFYHETKRLAAVSSAELTEVATERMRGLLAFASEHLPYYQTALPSVTKSSCAADPYATLTALPVLSKADVRAHADELIHRDVPGGLIPCGSGGTTGDTLRFFIDRIREAQPLGCRLFMQELFGVRPGDRRVHLWGSPIESRASRFKHGRDRLLNEMLLNAFDLSPKSLDRYLDAIRRFRPRLIYSYPTAAALLAQHAARRSRAGDFDWLRLFVLTGEEITPDQRAQVREAFGCAVASEYGSREVGLIAHECPHGGLHVISHHIHVEILKDGLPLPVGDLGEIACTNMTTRAQPMIRYRLGDVGRLVSTPCECGLPFPLMRIEGGRTTGFVVLSDGRLCHGAISSTVLRDEPGIVQFRTVQKTVDRFEVFLVVDERFDPRATERIRHRYRSLFGSRVQVQTRIVEQIPPDPSGKRRHVISEVAPDYWNFRSDSCKGDDLVLVAPESLAAETTPNRCHA